MFPLTISPPCFDLTLRLSVSQCTFGKKRRFYRKYIQNKSYKQNLLHELNLYRSAHLIRKYISYSVQKKKKQFLASSFFVTGNVLSSRAVSSQVLSALKGLTSVFGMRTGGSPSPLSPVSLNVRLHTHNCIVSILFLRKLSGPPQILQLANKPRPISIGQLNALQHLHTRPISS